MPVDEISSGVDEIREHVGSEDEVHVAVRDAFEVPPARGIQSDVGQVRAALARPFDHRSRDVEADHRVEMRRQGVDEAADAATDIHGPSSGSEQAPFAHARDDLVRRGLEEARIARA